MIDRILVPLDGSMTAEAVLPQVRRLLRRKDSEVVFVRAVVPPPVENSLPIIEAAQKAAEDYMEGMKARWAGTGVRVHIRVRLGEPSTVILETAEEFGATLIALATHGSRGVKRFLMGSVAEQVIRRSPVPVLAFRPFFAYELAPKDGGEFDPVRSILMPVDDAALAIASVGPVAGMARIFESRVTLLRVVPPVKGRLAPSEALAAAKESLKPLAARFEKRGVEVLTIATSGPVAREILDCARFHEADLLAMPTHGRTGLKRLVLGSVTEQVLRETTRPMLILAPAKRAYASPKGRRTV
jgi:nucleotide-binding universal stress UspA family protein